MEPPPAASPHDSSADLRDKYTALVKKYERLMTLLHVRADEHIAAAAFATAAMRSHVTGHVYLRGDLVAARNQRFFEMERSEGGPWRSRSELDFATLTDVVRAQSRELRAKASVERYTRADGERVFEVRTERIGDKPLPLVAATVFDVSDVVNAARTAEAARTSAKVEALQEANRNKDEFIGMLSHELRNPLAPIRNSVYILEHVEAGTDQARHAREVLHRQVAHMARLVDDLLDLTRMERGKLEIRRDDVDLGGVARRTAEDHRELLQQRGITLDIEVPGQPVRVSGDDDRIAQVIGNLLHNAAKFTGKGGRVAVLLSIDGHLAALRVRDTGVGMDPALLAHVFEPFTQARQSLARSAGGLGLGLALVKAVVELHGGTVHATSAGSGLGSEFLLRFPLAAAAATAGRTEPIAPPQVSGRHVLIVEDNFDAAASLADVVKTFGHHVEVVHDGRAAVEHARASRPDIVLCDIGLPGMSGYEVAHELRDRCAHGMRLIAVSGYARPDDVRRAMEAGFEAHLAKPCDPDVIHRLLGSAPDAATAFEAVPSPA